MRRSLLNRFVSNENAAIGPLYALGISVFVVMSAVGFDYGRLMALDTELQNAADQAALAAATQLDGSASAMANARNAANSRFATAGSAYVNETRFANDKRYTLANDTRPIVSLSYRFYDAYNSNTDVPGNLLTNDTQSSGARVVEVTVNARRVFYAMTPLVGLVSSGDVIGKAMAGIQNATCNAPPMMFCLPKDSSNNVITSFPTAADIGRGMKLHFKTQGNANGSGTNTSDTDVWAPGNFGFLDIDYGINGNDKVRTLGLNAGFLGCAGEVIKSDPGYRDPQGDALNSRFDYYSGSVNSNACSSNSTTGDFCPASSTRKDFTVTETKTIETRVSDPVPAAPQCGDYDTRSAYEPNTAAKNFKQDNCFSASTNACTVIGDGVWDRTDYLSAHHPSATAADFGKSTMDQVTRYDVYLWELADPANRLRPERISTDYRFEDSGGVGNPKRDHIFTNVCSYPTPIIKPPGLSPSATQKDRRLLTVAAVDCTGLNGSAPVRILRWVDMFLVEPSNTSSNDKNFFVEIVGSAKQANGGTGFQFFGRQKAVLFR